MVAKRVRLAGALDRLGLLNVLLAARARSLLPGKNLTVLTFHRVVGGTGVVYDQGVADTTPETFERQVQILKRYFTLVDTRDLEAHRAGVPLPDNPAMISFDDGYRDNFEEALPILRRQGAKAVFFIATSFIEERRLFWWDRVGYAVHRSPLGRLALTYPSAMVLALDSVRSRRDTTDRLLRVVKETPGLDLARFIETVEEAAAVRLPRAEERALADAMLMTWDHVRALKAAGMDVQSHTHRHRVLQTMTEEEAMADLTTARRLLESRIQAPVHALAYPAGRSVADHPGLLRAVGAAGYRLAMTSGTGVARLGRSLDWLDVPRVAIAGGMPEPFFRGCLAIPSLAW